jgi:hypothetical protein
VWRRGKPAHPARPSVLKTDAGEYLHQSGRNLAGTEPNVSTKTRNLITRLEAVWPCVKQHQKDEKTPGFTGL